MSQEKMCCSRVIIGVLVLTGALAKANFTIPERSNDSLTTFGQGGQGTPYQKALQQGSGIHFFPQDKGDDKRRLPPVPAADSETMLWLLPVLRYLIIFDGQSIHLQAKPVMALLPFVFPVAQWWFGSDQTIELAQNRREVPIGDPIPIYPQSMDGNGDKGADSQSSQPSKNQGGEQAFSSQSTSVKKQQSIERQGSDNQSPDDEEEPPAKKHCDRVEYPGELLSQAVRSGDVERVSYILERYQNPNERWNREFPLHLAAELGYPEICRELIRHGSNIEEKTRSRRGILEDFAIDIAHITLSDEERLKKASVIKVFIEEGAPLPGCLFIELLADTWDDYHELRVLAIDHYQKNNISLKSLKTIRGTPVLHHALDHCREISIATFQWLLETGFDCNHEYSINYYKIRPLFYFLDRIPRREISQNVIEIVKLFIKHDGVCIRSFRFLLMRYFDEQKNLRELAFESLSKTEIDFESFHLVVEVASDPYRYSESALRWFWGCLSGVDQIWGRYQTEILQKICAENDNSFIWCELDEIVAGPDFSIVVTRLRLLLSFGVDFTISPDSGNHPVALILRDQWDRYPEFREQALQQFEKKEMDIGEIKPGGRGAEKNTLLFYMMEFSKKFSVLCFEWLQVHSPAFRAQLESNGDKAVRIILTSSSPSIPLTQKMMEYLDLENVPSEIVLSIFRVSAFGMDDEGNLFDMILDKWNEKGINPNIVDIEGGSLINFLIMNAEENLFPVDKIWNLLGKKLLPVAIKINELPEYGYYHFEINYGYFDPEKEGWQNRYPVLHLACAVNRILGKTLDRVGLQFRCLIFLMKNPDIRIEQYPSLPPGLLRRSTQHVMSVVRELTEQEREEIPEITECSSDDEN